MPILKGLKKLDWPTLATELVLIFVGITAALWFDNLNQTRDERRRESEVLVEIAAALASDTADLHINLRATAGSLASIDTILHRFDESVPYDSTLADHFRRASVITNFLINAAAYEYLKSVGLGLISDDGVRRDITQYYEVDVQYLKGIEAVFVNQNWIDTLRPQMVRKFDYGFFFAPATPHDYGSLARDRELRSVLRTTREILEWKGERTRLVLERAEELLARLQGAS